MVSENMVVAEDTLPGNKAKDKKFICELGCSEAFGNVLTRRNHHASFHRKAFAEATGLGEKGRLVDKKNQSKNEREETVTTDASPAEIGGVNMGAVSELTRKFAQALVDTAPDMGKGKQRQIIHSFDSASYTMANDAAKMTSFLTTCGLTASQSEFIKMVMLGADPGQPSNGNAWGQPSSGGPQAMTYDQRTGQLVPAPIFMLNGNNAPAAAPGYSGQPVIMMPPSYGAAQPQGDVVTHRDLEAAMDRLAEKLKPAEPTAAVGPPIRRIQKVLTDDHGNAVTDAAGNFLTGWVEEPISTQNDTIHMLKEIGAIGKDPAPAISPGEIAEAVQSAVAPLIPDNSAPSPEMVEMREELRESRKEFGEFIHRSELKDAETRAAEEAVSKTMLTVQPYLDELKEMRTKTGLSDAQFELQHQETSQRHLLNTLQSGLMGIRQDLQPLAMQTMVASLKGAGLDDNVIGDLLQRMAISPVQGGSQGTDDRKAETMRNWVKQ